MAGLQAQLWRSAVVDSRRCLVKGVFGGEEGAGYEVLLWDGGVMWTEKLEEEGMVERMATLNPNVEAPSSLVISHLSSLLYTSLPAFAETEAGNGKTLSISGSMSGGLPFSWQFHCTPAPHDVVETHLVGPLLSCLHELCCQRRDLLEVMRKKEREIQDYRDGGASLSRRNLETAPFQEKTFSTSSVSSQRFEDCVQSPHKLLTNDYFQSLYQSVATATVIFKDKVLAQDPGEESSTKSEGRDDVPSSLPGKRPLPAKEDEEMGRREALERKLDDERIRGKKKKKRLM
jgi:non-homologous end-joining factor 1